MKAKTIMVQGTASSVGKSMLVTALCRIFRQDGFRVAPFKAQNMALNSFVTADGGELGRSQAVQAEAAGTEMSVDMNPILLKPETDSRCQVIVHGRPYATLSAGEYYDYKGILWPKVAESLERLRSAYDLIIIEGAGSPAEINLRENDIVNMRVALAVQAPVLLVGDIDRGGVLASMVGTLMLLRPEERAMVKALIVNKFRGDLSLFKGGVDMLEAHTGLPVAGVLPYFRDLRLPEEDSVALDVPGQPGNRHALLDVAVVRLPHISNFDDFDALGAEPEVRLRIVEHARDVGEPDVLILPGSKTTVGDLEYLRQSGWAEKIFNLADRGTPIVGICGGYQMLGRTILDPQGVESPQPRTVGLGLLPVDTTFAATKRTCRVQGEVIRGNGILSLAHGQMVEGYEIHMGETRGSVAPPIVVTRPSEGPSRHDDGAISENGLVFGTYVHGIFNQRGFRHGVLRWLAERKNTRLCAKGNNIDKEHVYDHLAGLVRDNLDVNLIRCLTGLGESR